MTKKYLRSMLPALILAGGCLPQTGLADAIEGSTAASPTWFRIYTPNRQNLTVTARGDGAAMKATTSANLAKPYSGNMLWRLEAKSDGTYYIISMDGTYVSPSNTLSGGSAPIFAATSTKPSAGWTIKETASSSDLYTVVNGSIQWNMSQDAPNYYLYNWGSGSNTSDTGCQFRFEKVTLTDLEAAQAEALTLLSNTTEGNNPGEYSTEARSTFTTAVGNATTTAEVAEAKTAYEAAMNQVVAGSTYYMVSGPSASYCEGKYVYSAGSGEWPLFGDKKVSSAYAWTFVDAGNGQFYVQNYQTKEYIEPTTEGYGNNGTRTQATASTKYTVKSLGQGAFNIIPDGHNPLHAQNDGSKLVTWEGGLNTASAWRLVQIPESDLTAAPSLSSVTVASGAQNYAPGNTEQVLMKVTADVAGFSGNLEVNSFTLDLATNSTAAAADLENVKVYKVTSTDFIAPDASVTKSLAGTLATAADESTVTFDTPLSLESGTHTFYVVADVKADATVGDSVNCTLKSIAHSDGQTFTVSSGDPEGIARIYSVESTPYRSYDLGSHYWRIPAMVVLKHQTGDNASKNGRVITMADNRFAHNGDLPNHIDVYERHSDDNGKTWSDHKIVAGDESRGDHTFVNVAGNGFGDAALVESSKGRVIAIMVAGQYYFSSTNDRTNCNLPVIITSDDAGETWSAPRSLYDELYNGTYEQGQVLGSFAGSGRGIVLQRQKDEKLNGRIMFAMSHRFANTGIQEYIIYSDDEGETWKMSEKSAYSGGDESKLVELADGTVMISVRQSGNRGFNTSTDGGNTWGTQTTNANISGAACNADILYYNKNVLLHSYINAGSRKNLTVKASYDNGKTWGDALTVCAPSSAYSTMDITKDGDVAIFYEDAAASTGYTLNYAVFPIDWIVEGGDPAKKAFTSAMEKAKTIAGTTGYDATDIANAKAGQYDQAMIDKLSDLVAEYENQFFTDYDVPTEQLEALIADVEASVIVVDGFAGNTTFAISSYETINSTSAYTLTAEGAAAETSDAQWIITPLTGGQASIKLVTTDDTDSYFTRSGNNATVSSSAYAWTITKAEGADYWYLKSATSYLVINTSTGALNFWNNTTGNATWSTKWVLTAKGTVETKVDSATSAVKSAPVRYYDLNGRRVSAPAKGVYITSDGRKVVR